MERPSSPASIPMKETSDGATSYHSTNTMTHEPTSSDSSSSSKAVSPLVLRIQYGAMLLLAFVFGVILRSDTVLDAAEVMSFGYSKGCGTDSVHDSGTRQCLKDQPAYRLAFASSIFFLVHLLVSHKYNCCIPDPKIRILLNTKWPILRAIVFVALCFVMLYIPDGKMFDGLAWVFMAFSVLYLIAQLVIFIAFAYDLNDNWVNRDEKHFTVMLLGGTAILFLGGITMTVLLYVYFGRVPSCNIAIPLITINFALAIVYVLLSTYVEHGSLFPSAIVFVYTMWLCYSAFASGIPIGECNRLSSKPTEALLALNAIIAAASLAVTCTAGATSRGAFSTSARRQELISSDDAAMQESVFGGDETLQANHISFFHLMMFLGSSYMAMLLTSWQITGQGSSSDPGSADDTVAAVDTGIAVMGVRLACALLCVVLYTWTLVAPLVCKSRDFS